MALQYLKQDDIGDKLRGAIDTYHIGAKVGVKAYGFNLTGYYAECGDDEVLLVFGGGKYKPIQKRIWNSPWSDLEA